MQIIETALAGVFLIQPKIFGDSRGFFFESYQAERYQALGITEPLVQANISRSSRGVLRGLHYQLTQPQDKLVTVLKGRVFDVAVDIRPGSATFGQWVGFELNDENHHQLFVPKGFAHGFEVLSDEADFLYQCSDYYHPASEQGIAWNDPDLAINWQTTTPLLSTKDKEHPRLKDVASVYLPPAYL